MVEHLKMLVFKKRLLIKSFILLVGEMGKELRNFKEEKKKDRPESVHS